MSQCETFQAPGADSIGRIVSGTTAIDSVGIRSTSVEMLDGDGQQDPAAVCATRHCCGLTDDT